MAAHILLGIHSKQSEEIIPLLPGRCQAVFGPSICPIDGGYVSSSVDFDINMTFGANKRRVPFTIMRSADILKNFVFKIIMPLLPQGVKWRRNAADLIFESIEYSSGGHLDSTISLMKNNSMCKSRGLWPIFNNNPANIDPSKDRWVLTIPIMFSNCIPVIKLFWHESRIDIINTFERWQDLTENMPDDQNTSKIELDVTLCCDGFYLDRKCRAACATEDTKPVLTPVMFGRNTLLEKQDIIESADCVYGETSCIRIKGPTQGLLTHSILAYTVDEEIPFNSHPVNSMVITVNGMPIETYYYVEMEELNWLKCGMLSPISESKGNSLCKTFLYLIPYTFDPLSDFPTCWLEAGTFDNLIFTLEAKMGSKLPRGEIKIMSQALNIRKYRTGMTGLLFQS